MAEVSNYLELAIPHYSTSKLSIEIFLVRHASTETLLPEHLPESGSVVVRIVPKKFPSLRIASFKLQRS